MLPGAARSCSARERLLANGPQRSAPRALTGNQVVGAAHAGRSRCTGLPFRFTGIPCVESRMRPPTPDSRARTGAAGTASVCLFCPGIAGQLSSCVVWAGPAPWTGAAKLAAGELGDRTRRWAAGPAARRRRWPQALQLRLMTSGSRIRRNWRARIGECRVCHTAALGQRG